MENKPKTIFLDIDGTLIHHYGSIVEQIKNKPVLLKGTLEKLVEWDRKEYKIILTTGRKGTLRKQTEEQLQELGIFYDQLVMDCGGGVRVLINDLKHEKDVATAIAFCVKRNIGIEEINI